MNCYYSYPHSRKQGWLCFLSALTNSSLSKLCSIMMWSTFVRGVALDVIYVVLSHSLHRIWQGQGHFLCVQAIELFSPPFTISIVLEVVHGDIIVNISDKIHSSIPAIVTRFVMVIWARWSLKEMRIILEWVKRSEIRRKSCLCDK